MVKILKLIIVIAIILLLYTFKRYQDWLKKPMDPGIPKYVMEDDGIDREQIDLKKLYETVNFEFLENNFGSEFKNIYYNGKEMNNEFYIYMGILPIIKDEIKINCKLNKEISGSNVDSNIKKMFGNITYKRISYEFSDKSVKIKYDDLRDIFTVETNKCSGVDYTKGGVKTEYISAYKEQNIATIEENIYFLKTLITDSDLSYNYYLGFNEEGPLNSNSIEKLDRSKLPKYKLIFETKDNNYYFKGIKSA